MARGDRTLILDAFGNLKIIYRINILKINSSNYNFMVAICHNNTHTHTTALLGWWSGGGRQPEPAAAAVRRRCDVVMRSAARAQFRMKDKHAAIVRVVVLLLLAKYNHVFC